METSLAYGWQSKQDRVIMTREPEIVYQTDNFALYKTFASEGNIQYFAYPLGAVDGQVKDVKEFMAEDEARAWIDQQTGRT